jgi:signal transduction histidine kinase
VKDKDDGTFVNMQEVIKNTVDSLEADKFCKIRLKNGEMPVKINKTQIEQVLLNLIGNAIKHCDKPVPEIEVSCEIQENVLHLNVRDNGPGIDEKYHDKVFVIFQTLRARDEFESTGIGLSIVKRLVDDVGGKIGIISQSGNGTTFWLHWPVEHPEEKQTNYKIAALF